MKAGAGAVVGDPFFGYGFPEEVQVRVTGRAIDSDDGGAGQQGRSLPVPHHPATGGEVQEAVFRADVTVQHQFLGMIDQQTAGTVNDALGLAGGAGGVEDVDRMTERQRREARRLAGTGCQGVIPGGNEGAGDGGLVRQLLDTDHTPERRQAVDQSGKVLLAGEHLAAITVAVHHDQRCRFDLAEAVKDGTNAEVR